MTQPQLSIRRIGCGDAALMAASFGALGWRSKTEYLFELYRSEQDRGEREVLLAFEGLSSPGTLRSDGHQLISHWLRTKHQNSKTSTCCRTFAAEESETRLVTAAESVVRRRSDCVGVGVGLHPGYNGAQRLYVLLGYVPDGNGITVGEQFVAEGDSVILNDELVLHLEKTLAVAHAG